MVMPSTYSDSEPTESVSPACFTPEPCVSVETPPTMVWGLASPMLNSANPLLSSHSFILLIVSDPPTSTIASPFGSLLTMRETAFISSVQITAPRTYEGTPRFDHECPEPTTRNFQPFLSASF